MIRLKRFAQDIREENVATILTRYSDILLAFFITSIVAMMLVPLPTPLLDLLLTTNIFAATTILFVSLYIQDATRIASFPTILLITTLFRLGLNVSSTRLILLQADAGEVIRAFGSFVAGGNLVVGLVIFLILTVIQFVVITKGAERVAEVSARFTLDALPGKQMSIDADFRAGLFDVHEARRRRSELQRESQLYGAMDGAMKFVKGDAIAGIIITVINLIGGFAIGVLQRGMDPGQSVRTYSLLTIGDGLVSQIPALLISVAAGIVVTRVASEEKESDLGKDIGVQILAQPKALAIVSVLLLTLALVPGLPTPPFLALGAVAGGIAYGLLRAHERTREAEDRTDREAQRSRAQLAPAAPILLQLSPELAERLASGERERLARLLLELPATLHAESGVLVPEIAVRTHDALSFADADRREDAPNSFAILLGEIPVHRGTVPLRGDGDHDEETVEPSRYLASRIREVLRRYLHELLGLQEVRALLDRLAVTHPALVTEVVPKRVELSELTEVLQRLVRERVSIRDTRSVLEAVAEAARSESDPFELTELVRARLARQICARFSRGDGKLPVYTVDAEIQQAIRESIRRGPAGAYLGLAPDLREEILAATRRALRGAAQEDPPVLLVEPEVRPHLKKLLDGEFPEAAVLSIRELTPELVLQPIGLITVIGDPAPLTP